MNLGGINNVSNSIASIYNSNSQTYADTLSRIASGKKINKPSDDFVGYIRAATMKTSVSGFETVQQKLTDTKGIASMMAKAGADIYEDLSRMGELAQMHADEVAGDNDADTLAAYANEFNALADAIDDLIDNTNYNGTNLLTAGTIKTVDLDPSGTSTFSMIIAAGEVPTKAAIDALDITTGATVADAQIGFAASYLVKAEGFVTALERHIDMTGIVIQSKNEQISLIDDIDEAEEMTKSIDQSIRQQASIAMLSQANVSRQGIMQLYM
jgi:flagellin